MAAEARIESWSMKVFRSLGLESVAWSLRRLHCPVDNAALVLEVGSGGNPYARANVLVDAYEETGERHWVPLKVDRPLVLGFAERLPFKNRAFDFVIASHVLEHSAQPEKFLKELQRVSKAGYIEVPDAFMERINPYTDHRLEITCRDNRLIIRKKPASVVEHDTVELYEHRVKPFLTREFIPRRPFAFHVRYYWNESIDFSVMNPEVDASWETEKDKNATGMPVLSIKARIHGIVLDFFRYVFSQNHRNRKIDLLDLLACPSCGATPLSKLAGNIRCNNCQSLYLLRGGIPVMYPQLR
ncbi:MAG: methyltransferase domain-containing protein [Gammaproteobacteria bacterium]|nr:methyltransferase domain-containing protein [Gammaproteobacteria bacterium]